MKNSIQFGIPEMDARVLHFLDAKTLLSICTLTSYTSTLLTKEFWMGAFKQLYPTFPITVRDSPLEFLQLTEGLGGPWPWEMARQCIDSQNIEVLKWLEQNYYICPGKATLMQALECKTGDEFSKVLKWLVEEHNVVPDEGDLMNSYDESWMKYCPDPTMLMDCDIKKWLLETYDIKMNEDDDF